jgi:hypothetical protein
LQLFALTVKEERSMQGSSVSKRVYPSKRGT